MEKQNITKSSLAQKLKTSRSQLDRILDPENSSITLEVLEHVAHAVGKTYILNFHNQLTFFSDYMKILN